MHIKVPNLFIFLDQYIDHIFKNNNTNIGIIYRNYTNNKKVNDNELSKIAKACKKKRYMLFIANNTKLALKFRADGIYIPAFNKTKSFFNFEKKNFIILGSAHKQSEIHQKKLQKCKIIFLAPTFFVEKSNRFLGIYKFNFLSIRNKIKALALGGINETNIGKLKLLRIKGFGGIGMFKKKTGLLKAGFLKNNFF